MLRQTRLRCHVVIDERSAAFFAQGIAKASHRPTLLLATSGTAPANWLPAVIEASQSGIPLILLSADRPPELQDCGANQTIDQLNLFGVYVRASHALGTPEQGFDPDYLHRLAARACAKASWPHPGPVHINQPFREPLIPETTPPIPDIPEKIGVSPPEQLPAVEDIRDLSQRISGRPGIIVCGEMPTTDAERNAIAILADRLNCPILAEPLSGMRFGKHDRSHVFVRYNAWLATQGLPRTYSCVALAALQAFSDMAWRLAENSSATECPASLSRWSALSRIRLKSRITASFEVSVVAGMALVSVVIFFLIPVMVGGRGIRRCLLQLSVSRLCGKCCSLADNGSVRWRTDLVDGIDNMVIGAIPAWQAREPQQLTEK